MLDATLENLAESALQGCFHVRAKLKPVNDGHVVVMPMAEGNTIADVLRSLHVPSDHWQFAHVHIEDQLILQRHWGRVRPNAGTTVFIKVTPGVTGAIALISLIAGSLATAGVTASATAAAIAASIGVSVSTLAAVAGAVVSTVVSFALSTLFAPSTPGRVNNGTESQVFSITSARNAVAPFGVVPEVVGQHRMVPPYGAVPFTEASGSNQFLRFIVLWGYGPVDVTDIKIGNTPIENFDNVLAEHDFDGTAETLSLYPKDVSQEGLSIVLGTSFTTRTTEIDADEISVDMTFPQGLFFVDSIGRRIASQVRLVGEYRRVGDTDFTSWFSQLVESRRTTAIRVSKRQAGLIPGQYEVRIRRTSAEQNNPSRQERVVWSALRSIRNDSPVNLLGIAKSAYRIRATDQLNGVIDQLNAIVGVKTATWDGSAWSGENATRNPASIFRRVLTSAANKKARTSVQIDNAGLGEWYEFCEVNNLFYDRVFDDQASVRDRLQDIAAAGFAAPRLVDGKWGVVVDKPKTVISQHFTPRNSFGFQGKIVSPEIPHGYRIRFPNRDRDFIEDERVVYDDGYDESNATEFQSLDAPGKTDPDDVFQWGRHILAAARLRPEIFTFSADIEHIVAERGDLIKFTHDVPRIGLTSGRVKSVSINDVTLDEPVTIEDGKTYTLRVRNSEGASTAQTVTTGAGLHSTITVADATGIAAGDLFMFGETGSESETLIIRAIEPDDDLGATLECVPYREAIYSAADVIPDYESLISLPSSVSFIGPPAPRISVVTSDEQALTVTSEGAIIPSIILSFQAGQPDSAQNPTVTTTAEFQARFKENTDDAEYIYVDGISPNATSVSLQPVETGLGYNVEIRAVGPAGEVSEWATISNHQVTGAIAPPPAVTTFGINVTGDQAYVEWTYTDIPVDLIGYEIRYSPDQDVTDWSAMTRVSESVPRSARSFAVPARSGSYAIKPFDVNGTRAETALFVNSSLEDPRNLNAIVSITEAPTFSGTKSNVAVSGSKLILDTSATMDTWTTLADVVTLSQGVDETIPVGLYDFGETDLGAVYTTRITADMVVGASDTANTMDTWETLADVVTLAGGVSGDEFNIQLWVSHSLTDAASEQVWTDYRPFVVGDYTARHFRFRLEMTSQSYNVIPEVTRLNVTIDAPDTLVSDQDIASGTAGKSIDFSPAFNTLQSVTVAAQDMGTGDYFEITGKSRTGFTVEFFNAAGMSVDRTFDYQALGFGHERGT
jgi:hypothetical protein